jgi:hypothetical protein
MAKKQQNYCWFFSLCCACLFNKNLEWYEPAGYAHYKPVELHINRDVLANEFKPVYFIRR